MQLDAELLIFDRNLGASQAAAIAGMTDLKVIDRSQLILDIFAQRAESADGKLQVELAQMQYLLPRLSQKDDALSRLSGGIGRAGPRRDEARSGQAPRPRAHRLPEGAAQDPSKAAQPATPAPQPQRRARGGHRGGTRTLEKSTLLNALTESNVLAENKLFATLDTRSRRIRFPQEREVVITDTVGFIRDLPKDLFNAFRATFEEAQDADLLLHVIDVSDPAQQDHVKTTEKVLAELELERKPRILVYNKMDRADARTVAQVVENPAVISVAVSATDQSTLAPLLEKMGELIFSPVPEPEDDYDGVMRNDDDPVDDDDDDYDGIMRP
jgi:GTP-binding protein HflX